MREFADVELKDTANRHLSQLVVSGNSAAQFTVPDVVCASRCIARRRARFLASSFFTRFILNGVFLPAVQLYTVALLREKYRRPQPNRGFDR